MLDQFKRQLQQVTGPVAVHKREDQRSVAATLEAPDKDVQLEVAWDKEAHFVVGEIHSISTDVETVLGIYNSLGHRLGCGSVFVPDVPGDADPEAMGYSRQYVLPLRRSVPTGVRYWLIDAYAADVQQQLQSLLGIAVTRSCPAVDERPYLYSLEWEGYRSDEKFALYVHLHSISQSAYLEELTIPDSLRRRGIGTAVLELLARLAFDLHCRYLYLWAKSHAEAFWQRKGLQRIFRANLRNQRRRADALRRRPGWDRAWFEGIPLEQPLWFYRNHPQDDLDLYLALHRWPTRQRGSGR